MKLVRVTWEDTQFWGEDGWTKISDIGRQPAYIIETAGFLVYEDEFYIVVAHDYKEEKVENATKIPKAVVKNIAYE